MGLEGFRFLGWIWTLVLDVFEYGVDRGGFGCAGLGWFMLWLGGFWRVWGGIWVFWAGLRDLGLWFLGVRWGLSLLRVTFSFAGFSVRFQGLGLVLTIVLGLDNLWV